MCYSIQIKSKQGLLWLAHSSFPSSMHALHGSHVEQLGVPKQHVLFHNSGPVHQPSHSLEYTVVLLHLTNFYSFSQAIVEVITLGSPAKFPSLGQMVFLYRYHFTLTALSVYQLISLPQHYQLELCTMMAVLYSCIVHMLLSTLNLKFYLIINNLHLNCYMWSQYWTAQVQTEVLESIDHLCFSRPKYRA